MTLSLSSPWLTLTRFPPPKFIEPLASPNNGTGVLMPLLFAFTSFSKSTRVKASFSASDTGGAADFENSVPELLDDEVIAVVSSAKDADEALRMIADKSGRSGGIVSVLGCRLIIVAALERNNPELALSVFYAMRSSFYKGLCIRSSICVVIKSNAAKFCHEVCCMLRCFLLISEMLSEVVDFGDWHSSLDLVYFIMLL